MTQAGTGMGMNHSHTDPRTIKSSGPHMPTDTGGTCSRFAASATNASADAIVDLVRILGKMVVASVKKTSWYTPSLSEEKEGGEMQRMGGSSNSAVLISSLRRPITKNKLSRRLPHTTTHLRA